MRTCCRSRAGGDSPGRQLRAYLDGDLVSSDDSQQTGFHHWRPAPLVFGGNTDGRCAQWTILDRDRFGLGTADVSKPTGLRWTRFVDNPQLESIYLPETD